MKFSWIGHATIVIVTEKNTRIVIDPYAPSASAYERKADILLISHHHYDHYNRALAEKVCADTTVILTTPAIVSQFHQARVLRQDKDEIVGDIVLRAVPAYNVSKPYHPKGLGIGFLLTIEGKTLYIAGDTDIIPEMKDVSAMIAILPVGGTYTMTSREAVQAVKDVKAGIAIPTHWGSVVGSRDDAELFSELCKSKGVIVHLLKPGESVVL